MKKRIGVIVLCLMLIMGLLAACGDSKPAGSSQETTGQTAGSTNAGQPDKVYTLSVTSHDPESSATGRFLNAWAERVREASGGALEIQVFHGGTLAGPKDCIDAVQNGTVDIAWGLQSFYDGMFPVTEVFMLPLIDIKSAPQGSRAIWNFYKDTDYMDAEYTGYHVLFFHTNCQTPLSLSNKSSVKKVEKISDLAGLNIRGLAGPPNSFLQELGATAMGCAIGDLYKNLETAEMDGCLTDWHAINSFKLDEVIGSFMDENIGVSTYFLLMNQSSYDALPENLQKILDETTAGCAELTSEWDDVEAAVKERVADKMYKLSPEARAELEAAADRTIQAWIAKTPDGQAIYDKAMAEIEAAK